MMEAVVRRSHFQPHPGFAMPGTSALLCTADAPDVDLHTRCGSVASDALGSTREPFLWANAIAGFSWDASLRIAYRFEAL